MTAGSECFGDCPDYRLTIGSDGQLSYLGKRCTARPGVFRTQLTQARIDELKTALAPELPQALDENEPGCSREVDSATVSLTVELDGEELRGWGVYASCRAPGAERVRELHELALTASGTKAWVEDGPSNCGLHHRPARAFEGTYHVATESGDSIGVLSLELTDPDVPRWVSFRLHDCNGELLAENRRSIAEYHRRILMRDDDQPLQLPILGEVGAIVLTRDDATSTTSGQALATSGDSKLVLTPRTSCPE